MAFTEIDEKLLVRAYQAGDERAFDTIVRTQYQALYAHALRRLSQHEAAEDAVQDTLVRAYRALPNLDGDLALRAWLHRILTNVCHDEGNRRRRQHGLVEKVAALPEDIIDDPVDEAVLHDTVRIMSEALTDLPASYREALVLRYVDGLSYREVAEATGVSEENARARVHRGRLALRKVLSRIAVLAAFIIPGLRRPQAPGASSGVAAAATTGGSDQAVNLATQLTSHVMTAAPTVSRFAEMASSLSSGKSALAAAAVTAVAAVSVPVAVHTVQDATRTERPAPAVAAPAPGHADSLTTPSTTPGAAGAASSTSSSATSSSTTPPSQAHPFEFTATSPATATTLSRKAPSSTTSTTAPPPGQGPVVEGKLGGDSLRVSGSGGHYDLSGPVNLTVNGKTTTGTIDGRLLFYVDGTAEADSLTVTLGGKSLTLRVRGQYTQADEGAGVTTYQITGAYSFQGASSFGMAESGDVTALFRDVTDASSSLMFDLRGRAHS